MRILPVQHENRQYNNQPSFGLGISPSTEKWVQSMLEKCLADKKLIKDVYNSQNNFIDRLFTRPNLKEKAEYVMEAYTNKLKEMLGWDGDRWKLHLEEPEITDDKISAPTDSVFSIYNGSYRTTRHTTQLSINNNMNSGIIKEVYDLRIKKLGISHYMNDADIFNQYLKEDTDAYLNWCSNTKSKQEFELFKSILNINKKDYLKAAKESAS